MLSLAKRITSAVNHPGPVMALGLGLRSFSQFVLLVLFTRLGGQAVAAEFVLAVAVLAPALPLCDMALRTILVLDESDLPLGPPLRIRLAAYALLLVTLLVAVCPLVGIDPVILLSLFGLKCVDAFADLYHAMLQRSNRMSLVGWLIASNAAVSSAMAVLMASSTGIPISGLYASVFTSACFLWIARSYAYPVLGPSSNVAFSYYLGRGTYKYLLSLGLPIGGSVALIGLASAFPQYVLAATSSPMALTTFAYLTYVVVATDLLINGLTQASLRKLADVRSQGTAMSLLRYLWRRSTVMSATVTIGCLASLPLISWVIELASSHQIKIDLVEALLAVSIVSVLPYAFLMPYGLNALKNSSGAFASNSLGAVTILVASLLLIPRYDLRGALLAMLLSTLVRGATAFILLRKRVGLISP